MTGGKPYLGLEAKNPKFRAFSRFSKWNKKLDLDNVYIDPKSGLQIENLNMVCKVLKANIKNWTIPVHYIDSRYSKLIPVVSSKSGLEHTFHESVDPKQIGMVMRVPIPDQCWPDPKPDAHLCIVDTYKWWSYDFSKFERRNGNAYASTFNVWDLSTEGERDPFSGKSWWKNGSRGSGAPLLAGLVLIGDIEIGKIRHKIACALPSTLKDYLRLPATRTDGTNETDMGIPEGSVLFLNYIFDDSGLNAETRVLTKAMKEYGLIVVDTSSDFTIYFQNLGQDKGKWAAYDFQLSKIPIDQFKVMDGEKIKR